VITSSIIVDEFLGIHIEFDDVRSSILFTQQQLIKSIIALLGLDEKSNPVRTPALSNVILHAHQGSPPHNETWSYRSVIGKMKYLEKSTRPDISYAVHQCARFCENPTVVHTAAVNRIGRCNIQNTYAYNNTYYISEINGYENIHFFCHILYNFKTINKTPIIALTKSAPV
jgi:hypothetical protein